MNNKNHVNKNGLENSDAKTKSNNNTGADKKDIESKLKFDDNPGNFSNAEQVEKVKQVDPIKVYATENTPEVFERLLQL